MIRAVNGGVARTFAEAGFAVFPVRVDNKKPLVKWRSGSTHDLDQVIAWWRQWPLALVGLDLAKCGLLVLDADRHGGPDGVHALAELIHQHGADFAEVPIVRTPSDGLHFYFRQPAGEPLGNREGDLPEGINVRGAGGLVIAPGSTRPDGSSYQQVAGHPSLLGCWEVPVIPEWLVEIISARPMRANVRPVIVHRGTYSLSTTRRQAAWASAALEASTSAVAGAPNGHRNQTLNAIAFRLGRIVGRGWLARSEVEMQLRAAADRCGLTGEDGIPAVMGTIRSGLEAGMRAPVPDLGPREQAE